MRIAVSGTHASGKTTLIEAFLALRPQYAYEPEPYEVLQEIRGEQFASPPTMEEFELQLRFQLETLARYAAGGDVIFERCPLDFLAYMLAVEEAGFREHSLEIDPWLDSIRDGVSSLDAIVFLPLDERTPIQIPPEEHPTLRQAVDDRLQRLLLDDELDLFGRTKPAVIEARGTLKQRLRALESIVEGAP